MKKLILASLLIFFANNAMALEINDHVVTKLKKEVVNYCSEILKIDGNYNNNIYYVNLKDGRVKDIIFENLTVSFEGLSKSMINSFNTDGFTFEELKDTAKIKMSGTVSPIEIQQVINSEILKSSVAHRKFSEANFEFDDDSFTVTGKVNMKRIPGNPFALISADDYSPFTAKLSVSLDGTCLNLSILEGSVNGEEMTPELKTMFLNWLNPIWDFSKFGFNFGADEFRTTKDGLKISAYFF